MNELILYTVEDGRNRIQLRADGQTVWLTQREMAELFNVSTDNIGLHLKNLYEDGELARKATTEGELCPDPVVNQCLRTAARGTGHQARRVAMQAAWSRDPQEPKLQCVRAPGGLPIFTSNA